MTPRSFQYSLAALLGVTVTCSMLMACVRLVGGRVVLTIVGIALAAALAAVVFRTGAPRKIRRLILLLTSCSAVVLVLWMVERFMVLTGGGDQPTVNPALLSVCGIAMATITAIGLFGPRRTD